MTTDELKAVFLLDAVRSAEISEARVLAGREMPDLSSLVATCIECGLDPERLVGPDWLDTLLRCKAFLRNAIAEAELSSRSGGEPVDRTLQPGERVSYVYDYLASIGQHPGGELDRSGRVVEVLRDYLPGKDAVLVAWDDGIESVTAYWTVDRLHSARTNADSATWDRDRRFVHLDSRRAP